MNTLLVWRVLVLATRIESTTMAARVYPYAGRQPSVEQTRLRKVVRSKSDCEAMPGILTHIYYV